MGVDGVEKVDTNSHNRRARPKLSSNPFAHRLHYRWSELEADKSRLNIGAPQRPFPQVCRTLELKSYSERKRRPRWYRSNEELARFTACNCTDLYKSIDYNTFLKNPFFKLTEVEVYFLSRFMTRVSSQEWAVVYLGVSDGERFRHLRDYFFPNLTVVAFDPFLSQPGFSVDTVGAMRKAELWMNDGTGFFFHVRCFEIDKDVALIREQINGKKLLLISDIRGCAMLEDGVTTDKGADNELQWQAIKALRPVSSLVKFQSPEDDEPYLTYPPGILLKQTFQNYSSCEVRLMIDGVPSMMKRYDWWDISRAMVHHHEHLRGLVYDSTRPLDKSTKGLDYCFDCEVLWQTMSQYADQNSLSPYDVLGMMTESFGSCLSLDGWTLNRGLQAKPCLEQWLHDVEAYVKAGELTEAIVLLEAANREETCNDVDWSVVTKSLSTFQPEMAKRLSHELSQPASCGMLIQCLGSLSSPFVLVRTYFNDLLDEKQWERAMLPRTQMQ